MTESHPFESFVKSAYPYHHSRLKGARRSIRLCLLKGALSVSAFIGAPLAGVIWALRLVIENYSSLLQDGQKPIPYIHYLEPAAISLILLIFIFCVLMGAAQGYLRNQKLGLQIETDEMKLRSSFMLREIFDRQTHYMGNDSDETLMLRNPKGNGSSLGSEIDSTSAANPRGGHPENSIGRVNEAEENLPREPRVTAYSGAQVESQITHCV